MPSITATLNLPPLWTGGCIVLSGLLARQCPVIPFQSRTSVFFGLAIALLALGLIFWSALTLRRHQTTFIPHRSASQLVTTGPFRFSRHPIYLADLILLLASGLMIGSPWPFFFAPFLAIILRHAFILPEELMLQNAFPEEFKHWSSTVRRWL